MLGRKRWQTAASRRRRSDAMSSQSLTELTRKNLQLDYNHHIRTTRLKLTVLIKQLHLKPKLEAFLEDRHSFVESGNGNL